MKTLMSKMKMTLGGVNCRVDFAEGMSELENIAMRDYPNKTWSGKIIFLLRKRASVSYGTTSTEKVHKHNWSLRKYEGRKECLKK